MKRLIIMFLIIISLDVSSADKFTLKVYDRVCVDTNVVNGKPKSVKLDYPMPISYFIEDDVLVRKGLSNEQHDRINMSISDDVSVYRFSYQGKYTSSVVFMRFMKNGKKEFSTTETHGFRSTFCYSENVHIGKID